MLQRLPPPPAPLRFMGAGLPEPMARLIGTTIWDTDEGMIK